MKQCPICMAGYTDEHVFCQTDGARLVEGHEWKPEMMVRNKYRIVSKLGQGGMGTVYKAFHVALEEYRALKVMDKQLAGDSKFILRFRQEAQMTRRLRHPNVVQVDDLDQAEDGCLFIAMELVEGASLRKTLDVARGPLPLARAIAIARGVAEALATAHSLGMVHRDIKPDNILLARDVHGRDIPKVVDFGLVAMREGSSLLSSRPLMTPAYASPEQWGGMKGSDLDGRADLYSLGITMYEMLTGRLPWPARTIEEWRRAHLEMTPEPPSRYSLELAGHAEVDAIVLKLLAKNREQRTRDAQELIAQLNLLEAQYGWNKETVVVRSPGAGASSSSGSAPPVSPPRTPSPPQGYGAPQPPRPLQAQRPYQSPQGGFAPPGSSPGQQVAPWAPQAPPQPPQPPGGAQDQGYVPQEPEIRMPFQQQFRREEGRPWIKWLAVAGAVVVLIVGILVWQLSRPKAPTIVSFEAKPDSIEAGERSQLVWEVLHADSVNIEPDLGHFSGGKGSVMVAPKQDFTFELVATGSKSTVRSSVTVKVKQASPPPPPPRPTSRVIYEDDLRSQRNWGTGLGDCPSAYVLGGLSFGNLTNYWCTLKLQRGNAIGALDADVRLEVSVKLITGNPGGGFGVAFGAAENFQTSARSFYAFEVTANGFYQLFQWVGDHWEKHLLTAGSEWPGDPALRQGLFEVNRIRVDIQGNTISYFANGKHLGSFQAPVPVEGFAGLIVGGQGQYVVFSDLVITQLY